MGRREEAALDVGARRRTSLQAKAKLLVQERVEIFFSGNVAVSVGRTVGCVMFDVVYGDTEDCSRELFIGLLFCLEIHC